MKTRVIINSLLSTVLLFSVLFTQVIVAYLHDHHFEKFKIEDSGKAICKSDESCEICSLNFFPALYYYGALLLESPQFHCTKIYCSLLLHPQKIFFAKSGRSPPSV